MTDTNENPSQDLTNTITETSIQINIALEVLKENLRIIE